MRVERSTTDDLKHKLQALKKKKAAPAESEEIDFTAQVEQKVLHRIYMLTRCTDGLHSCA